jgi:CBS domain-containing protein
VFSSPVRDVMDKRKFLTTVPQTTVLEASRKMLAQKAGAVLVVEDHRLVGIFTERDAVFRVIAQGLDPGTTLLSDVMTVSPRTIGPDQSFGYAMIQMHENGFRHMPVVEDGRPIGIVSARNALDPDLEEFASEAQRRKHIRDGG